MRLDESKLAEYEEEFKRYITKVEDALKEGLTSMKNVYMSLAESISSIITSATNRIEYYENEILEIGEEIADHQALIELIDSTKFMPREAQLLCRENEAIEGLSEIGEYFENSFTQKFSPA